MVPAVMMSMECRYQASKHRHRRLPARCFLAANSCELRALLARRRVAQPRNALRRRMCVAVQATCAAKRRAERFL